MLKLPPLQLHQMLFPHPFPCASVTFPRHHNTLSTLEISALPLYLPTSRAERIGGYLETRIRHLPLRIEARKHAPRTESAKVRNLRSRKLLTGTSERPRLLVFCSDKHLYVQIVDDTNKRTLLSASTSQHHIVAAKEKPDHPVVDAAKKIGEEVAKECFRQGITKVIICRKGSLHRQRVTAFRLAAQDQGLEIQYAK